MIAPDINTLRDDLLIELANRRATNGSPMNVMAICSDLYPEVDWTSNRDLGRSAGWLLVRHAPPLAKTVTNSDKPGAMLLALTALGKSEASRVSAARKPPTLSDHLVSDKVQKISALVLSGLSFLVSIAALIVAYLAYQKA